MTLPDMMTALVLREDGYASGGSGDMPTDLSPHVELKALPVPHPKEGQALKWLAVRDMRDYPMPPADLPLIAILRDWL